MDLFKDIEKFFKKNIDENKNESKNENVVENNVQNEVVVKQDELKKVEDKVEEKAEDNKENENFKEYSIGFIDKIKQDEKVTTATVNSLKDERSKILASFASQTEDKGILCFVASQRKFDGTFVGFEYENNEENVVAIEKLPDEADVNSVLRKNDEGYVYDEESTQEILNKLKETADELIKKQNEELEKLRVEEHIYLVEEDRKGKIFLTDITSNNGISFEEVVFPAELIEQAKEGHKFVFQNGKYETLGTEENVSY